MLLQETTVVAVDFETTGSVPGYPDQPWQVGLVPVRSGEPDFAGAVEHWLRVSAERPFNPHAPGSWRMRRAELAAATALPELVPLLGGWLLGTTLVAHNAAAERKVLRQAWPLQRPGPWIDTLALARYAYPDLPAHDLGTVIGALGLSAELDRAWPGRGLHDALYDAAACALLLCHLVRQPAWTSVHVEDLAAFRNPRKPSR
jgi:DNA polymerase III epsilon subunit-like protein